MLDNNILTCLTLIQRKNPLCGSMSYANLYLIYAWRIKEKHQPKQNYKLLQNTKEVRNIQIYFKNAYNPQNLLLHICPPPYTMMLPALAVLHMN